MPASFSSNQCCDVVNGMRSAYVTRTAFLVCVAEALNIDMNTVKKIQSKYAMNLMYNMDLVNSKSSDLDLCV